MMGFFDIFDFNRNGTSEAWELALGFELLSGDSDDECAEENDDD